MTAFVSNDKDFMYEGFQAYSLLPGPFYDLKGKGSNA